MKVLWTRAALRHLSEARAYVRIDNPPAAERQIEKIRLSANRLGGFPMLGQEGRRSGTREFPVPGTPYLLVYRVVDERIEIIALLHGARNWKTTQEG